MEFLIGFGVCGWPPVSSLVKTILRAFLLSLFFCAPHSFFSLAAAAAISLIFFILLVPRPIFVRSRVALKSQANTGRGYV